MSTQLLGGAGQADLADSVLYVTPSVLLPPSAGVPAPADESRILDLLGTLTPYESDLVLLGSIARSAVVAGMLLGDSAAEISAELFRYPDLTTPIDTLTLTRTRSWAEILSDAGSGSITVQADDPALANFVEDGDDIVVFSYRGLRAFAMLVENKDETVVAEAEEAAEVVTYTGRGHLALLWRAVVYPTGGTGREPTEDDRLFNWASPEFEDETWVKATVLGTVAEALELAEFLWDVDPSTFFIGPTVFLTLVWAPGATWLNTIMGHCYFRQQITVAETRTYTVAIVTDDAGELYIDGQQVASTSGYNAMGVQTAEVDLTAGTHTVAAHVENFDNSLIYPGTFNGGKFGFGVWTMDLAGEVRDLVAQVDPNTLVMSPYPPAPPGMSAGQVMRLVLEENQADGVLTDITWDFTDATDSGGTPWPITADIGTKTGTDLLTFFREMSATYADLWMDPASLTLHAYVIDGLGLDKSASIELTSPTDPNDPTTGNLRAYTRTGEFLPVSEFLLRSRFGWSEREDAASVAAYGRRRVLLEIGAPSSIEEINRMADGQFAFFADPRTEINATIMPMSNADAPYWSYRIGDELMTPDGVMRVVGQGMEEDPDTGMAIPTTTLRSIIQTAQERVFQALGKLR